MLSHRSNRASLLAATTLALCTASPGLAATMSPSPASTFDADAARSECEEKGGQVQSRQAAWNTNADPAHWLPLAGRAELCRFQTLGEADDSRIYVDLATLVAHGPTLASVAYLSKVPLAASTDGANPAAVNCAALGGSSSFGSGGAGGGWVDPDDPIDKVALMCVFPDGSMIDEWGIAYYAGGTVRGADLALLLDYEPHGDLPPIFSR